MKRKLEQCETEAKSEDESKNKKVKPTTKKAEAKVYQEGIWAELKIALTVMRRSTTKPSSCTGRMMSSNR